MAILKDLIVQGSASIVGDLHAQAATVDKAGLMSAADKAKLDSMLDILQNLIEVNNLVYPTNFPTQEVQVLSEEVTNEEAETFVEGTEGLEVVEETPLEEPTEEISIEDLPQ